MSLPIADFLEYLKAGNNEAIQALLDQFPQLVEAKTEQGVSLLLMAAYFRNEDIKAKILNKKSSLDIFEAAACGKMEILKQHLAHQPDFIHSFSPDGFTPLGLAAFFGHLEAVTELLKAGANAKQASNNGMNVAPIHSAVAINSVEIVKVLLQHEANVNASQMQGVTALHSAVHRNNLEIAALLIENGANIQAKMEDGKTPLDIALEEGHTKMTKLLKSLA